MSQSPSQHRPPNVKAFIRLVLTLCSVPMIVFAGLTLAGVIALPAVLGWLFFAVAVFDLLMAYLVFKD